MTDTENKACDNNCKTVMGTLKCHMEACKKCAVLLLGAGGVMLVLGAILSAGVIKMLWLLVSLGLLGLGAMTFLKK